MTSSQSKTYYVQVKGPVTINGSNLHLGAPVKLTEAQASAWGEVVGSERPKAPAAEAVKPPPTKTSKSTTKAKTNG